MHILIVRISAIGDVIHTLPAIFLLKHQFPHAKIHWLVQQKAAALLINQPFIDNVWVLPNDFLCPKQWSKTLKIIKTLRQYSWDAIIDFQGLLKTTVLTCSLHGKKFGFSPAQAREKVSTWFTHHHDTPTYTNIVQKNLSLASATAYSLGKTTVSPSTEEVRQYFHLTVPQKQQKEIELWLAKNHIKKALLLCPNTTWTSKHWPTDHWVTFIKLLEQALPELTPVLVGTSFGTAAAQIASQIPQGTCKTCPPWDLLTMSHLIKHAQLTIAPDTGLLHMADFLGAPAIGLFGPTSKDMHGPFWTKINRTITIQVPCPHVYQKTHGIPDRNCMASLTPQHLLDQVISYLENTPTLSLQ